MARKTKYCPKVLAYLIGSISDTVVAIPSLKAIRRHYGPDIEICLLHEIHQEVNTTPADLLAGNPEVDRFLSYDFAQKKGHKLLSAAVLWWRLRHENFLVEVYLSPSQRTVEQVKRDMRFFRSCGIFQLIGFRAFSKKFFGSPKKLLYTFGYHGRHRDIAKKTIIALQPPRDAQTTNLKA